MRRRVRIVPGFLVAWRPLAPFAGLFVLLMVFAVGGMLVVAREADRSDAARAREAVGRTFAGMLARLAAAAEMNAAAPPIASALSGRSATPSSAYGYLNFTHSDALGYHGVVVLDHDGSAFAGTHHGLPWTGPALATATRIVAPVAARLPVSGTGTTHALLRDSHGEALAIAVTNVVADPRDIQPGGIVDLPRRLAMIAPVAEQLLPKMLPSLGVEDFRLVQANHDDNAVTIPVEQGAPVIFAWRPRTPGQAAAARWAPAMGTLLIAALIMLALAGHANMTATRALEQLAHSDSLTGLANRAAFNAELTRRQERGEAVALGMIDLNGFKAVNDEHGHPVGDELLHAVAAELARSAGPDDFVARLGGDEFAWISPSRAAADAFAATFGERIENPLAVGPMRLRVGAAIGIALSHPGMSARALVGIADARLYKDKGASRTARRDGTTLSASWEARPGATKTSVSALTPSSPAPG